MNFSFLNIRRKNRDPISDVGMLKRQAAKMVSSEHHIVQDGDKMSVNVIATGKIL